jgi:hypothetical protein
LLIKRRGRPRKNPLPQPAVVIQQSDTELLSDISERFGVLDVLVAGTAAGTVRSIIVSGSPGIGKSHHVQRVLRAKRGCTHEVISGAISAIQLYKTGYKLRDKNCVIVLDDVDKIWKDLETLSILKAMCDSSDVRTISWKKESKALVDEDNGDIPSSYDFEGAIVFITNVDLQRHINEGKNQYAEQFEAMVSRSMYLNLKIHDKRQVRIWVRHVAENGMFEKEGISVQDGAAILDYIDTNSAQLRDVSFRTVKNLINIKKLYKKGWESVANMCLNQ